MFRDFVSGALAGATTGTVVAVPEYMKVLAQTEPHLDWRQTLNARFLRRESSNLLRTIPAFAGIFGASCAIEFSVIHRVNDQYGIGAGIGASAVSGATFLTVADHLMYRQHEGQGARVALRQFAARPTAAFTGWTPMIAREAFFMGSVIALGPNIGSYLQAKFGHDQSSKRAESCWNFIGRLTAGFVTTVASQPFDSLARQMQMQYFKQPINPKSMFKLAQMMYRNKLFYRGAGPRLALATVGGALVGNLYTFYKDALTEWSPLLFGTTKPTETNPAQTNQSNLKKS